MAFHASSGGGGPEFSGGFWDWVNKLNHGGRQKWTDPETGMSYYINDAGEITGVYPITGIAPTPGRGLNNASTGLKILFKNGLKGNSIINVRSTLLKNGFTQSLTRNKSGYLFTNKIGEQVRIMSRNGTWDIRVMNQYGNYLNSAGNVTLPGSTHNIFIWSW